MMTFKPPYWYHDNIKFSKDEISELKSDFYKTHKLLKKEETNPRKDHLTSYFIRSEVLPDKHNDRYDKIIADIVKSVGLYEAVLYDYIYWIQLYEKQMRHNPHNHCFPIGHETRKYSDTIISWVHFINVPKKKCFRFTDNAGNTLIPDEQLSGDIIAFPSWLWHEVLPNESNQERIVISGNISVTHYD